ncbi:histidinol dehydrogenase [Marinagarivorans algicola]|uniref:histidinol dehydrogenase n=1 Tax=Marinagarivorans algicola TaxID=1513270 RepID=UPI0006B4DFFE|nr:histidinol dehydrogenase [Marinagarivorans algicola]
MPSPLINRLHSTDANFNTELSTLLAWDEGSHEHVEAVVKEVLHDVRARGDEAVLEYTHKFDKLAASNMSQLVYGQERLQQALASIPAQEREALEAAATRIAQYHEHQQQQSWRYTDTMGNQLGQKVTPMDRVGVYAPGGKAAYPSSVLMAAVTAKVAGVSDVVLVTPTPGGIVNETVLAAAAIAGVDSMYTIGGAQAVAALAYGTETIPKVDKIVGPGNMYVAEAKRAVFGTVDIDMIAGPSEILIISDGTANPDWIAMDLFSQAEHDEVAQAILLTHDSAHLEAVQQSIEKLLPTLARSDIAATSLRDRGALILVQDLAEAVEVSNRIAPEHLELAVADPEALLPNIRHAGAIFMGVNTSEALGDYCAGPNHVLPTSGTARFSSPLGVYDFQKRSSIIYCSAQGASDLGKTASVLARSESLEAHARSAEYRILSNDQ